MTELFANEKVITSAKCKLMQNIYDPDPTFCNAFLIEDALVLVNDELSKKDELLYHIPIYHINDFILIVEKKQKKGILKYLFDALVEGFANFLEGLGVIPLSEKKTDKLKLSFMNEQGEEVDLFLDMMKLGDSGLIKEYKKLIGK